MFSSSRDSFDHVFDVDSECLSDRSESAKSVEIIDSELAKLRKAHEKATQELKEEIRKHNESIVKHTDEIMSEMVKTRKEYEKNQKQEEEIRELKKKLAKKNKDTVKIQKTLDVHVGREKTTDRELQELNEKLNVERGESEKLRRELQSCKMEIAELVTSYSHSFKLWEMSVKDNEELNRRLSKKKFDETVSKSVEWLEAWRTAECTFDRPGKEVFDNELDKMRRVLDELKIENNKVQVVMEDLEKTHEERKEMLKQSQLEMEKLKEEHEEYKKETDGKIEMLEETLGVYRRQNGQLYHHIHVRLEANDVRLDEQNEND